MKNKLEKFGQQKNQTLRIKVYPNDLKFLDEATNVDEIWEQVLSDHMSEVYPVLPNCSVLFWNIMTFCNLKNNGYHKTENGDEYFKRLNRIIKSIKKKLSENPELGIVSLQEVPATDTAIVLSNDKKIFIHACFIEELMHYLTDEWVFKNENFLQFKDNKFGLLTLYNRQKITAMKNVTDQLDHSLQVQSGRMQLFDVITTQHETIRYVHGHCRYGQEEKKFREDIDLILDSSETQVCIAADFNKNMYFFDDLIEKGLCYFPSIPTSVSWDPYINKQIKNNIDGFLFKLKPQF